jgi:hypothetical protein
MAERKPERKTLSISTRLDLSGVVQELQQIRKSSGLRPSSTVQPVEGTTGTSLLELFGEEVKSLRTEPTRPSVLISLFINKLELPPEGPLAQAGQLVCQKVEEARNEPSYHNLYHVVEVILAAYVLGRRERLPIYRIAELLIAAAAHDLGHTGETNRYDYERETYSVQIAHPILQRASLPPENIQRIEQMILATDFKVGVPPARKAYLETRHLPPQDERRLLATQCLLLTEADVLFSCFDMSYNDLLSKLLSAEWKNPQDNLTPEQRISFLSYVQFISEASRQLGLEGRRKVLLKTISQAKPSSPDGPGT